MEILSEKEIIDIIKDFLKLKEIYSSNTIRKSFLSVYQEAIQELLDLYQAEKEKNKELENADLTTVYMNGFYDGEKKWKDKIKAKIEEYEEILQSSIIKEDYKKEVEHIIRILKELKGDN